VNIRVIYTYSGICVSDGILEQEKGHHSGVIHFMGERMILGEWVWILVIGLVGWIGMRWIQSHGVKALSPNAFYQLIQQTDSQLIDVREPEEYRDGHIPRAINVPIGRLSHHLPLLSKEKPVLLYCQSGNRSGIAARMLKKQGFKEVYHLRGGLFGWPYQTTRES
jgi:rhodanese-related sulfurtransferase